MGNIVKIDKDRLSQMLVEHNNGENVFDSSTSYIIDLQTSVDTLKEYKKPRQNTISDSPADLARALFGDDFMSMFEDKKSNEAVEVVAGESNKGM